MIKLRFNKPKMTQQFVLVVVVVLCLSSKSHRAFVSAADEDGGFETTTTEFGKNLLICWCLINHGKKSLTKLFVNTCKRSS
jgi:hypothetical protein